MKCALLNASRHFHCRGLQQAAGSSRRATAPRLSSRRELVVLRPVRHDGAFEGPGLLLQLLGSNSFGALQVGPAQVGSGQVDAAQIGLPQDGVR